MMVVFAIPIIAVIPDITYVIFQKVIFPSPTDWVLNRQIREPLIKYTGFDEVKLVATPPSL